MHRRTDLPTRHLSQTAARLAEAAPAREYTLGGGRKHPRRELDIRGARFDPKLSESRVEFPAHAPPPAVVEAQKKAKQEREQRRDAALQWSLQTLPRMRREEEFAARVKDEKQKAEQKAEQAEKRARSHQRVLDELPEGRSSPPLAMSRQTVSMTFSPETKRLREAELEKMRGARHPD